LVVATIRQTVSVFAFSIVQLWICWSISLLLPPLPTSSVE
jgi:hypothetical protein